MGVDKSDARVRKMFGEIAPGYDRMNHLLSMNVDRYWRWKTVRKLRPESSHAILDVCTGTADLALAFAKAIQKPQKSTSGGEAQSQDLTVRPGMVFGSDFCREMLQIGNEKSQSQNVANVRLVQADTQSLPFDADQFDIVTVAFGLRNVADTDQGIEEMTRVTKPGGQVAILEFSTPRRQPIKSFYGFYFRNILPRVGQMLARNKSEAYAYLPESVGEFPTYEALAKRMEKAGLDSVSFQPLTFGIATLYLGTKPQAVSNDREQAVAEHRDIEEDKLISSGINES